MADTIIRCNNCQTKLKVRAEFQGKRISCPRCKGVMSTTAANETDRVRALPPPLKPATMSSETPLELVPVSRQQLDDDASLAWPDEEDSPRRHKKSRSEADDFDDTASRGRSKKKRSMSLTKLFLIFGSIGFVVVALIIGTIAYFIYGASANTRLAQETVDKYYQAYTQKNWESALSFYSPEFFAKTPKEQWLQTLPVVRDRLGSYQSSQQTGWRYQADANGGFIALSFQVAYEKGQATETFTLRSTADGRMVIVGHTINSPALLAPNK